MKKDKIKVGLIGVGNWGKYGHVPVLQFLPQFEIVAVASRSKETAQGFAREFGIQHAFTDPDELIQHPDVDVVIVLPPTAHHAQYVRAAIAAGKHVYCEWPLTTNLAETEELLVLAEKAGVHHAVGLQRRMGPSARYVRDLVDGGYVGQLRSVRMHVSMPYFAERRPRDLAWTVPAKNFSHVLSIYGGHFLDLLFSMVGAPRTLSAVVQIQFPMIVITDTKETFPNETPDQVLVIGTLANGAAFTVQIEGGKRNGSGVEIDITGLEGDLKISNPISFGNAEDNKIEGSQGDNEPLRVLPIPNKYQSFSPSKLDASVLDLAYLYEALANDIQTGTKMPPTFVDAVRLHRLINLISEASTTGERKTVTFW